TWLEISVLRRLRASRFATMAQTRNGAKPIQAEEIFHLSRRADRSIHAIQQERQRGPYAKPDDRWSKNYDDARRSIRLTRRIRRRDHVCAGPKPLQPLPYQRCFGGGPRIRIGADLRGALGDLVGNDGRLVRV